MTEEKVKERSVPTVSEAKRESGPPLGERLQGEAAGMFFSACMGFFFGGAELPFGVYPLGTALVGALSRYGLFALIGIWLRCGYGALVGARLLLPALTATAVYLCRFALSFWIYGKALLLRAKRVPDTLLTRVLLSTAVTLVCFLIHIARTGMEKEKAFAMILSASFAAAFSFLYCLLSKGGELGAPAVTAGLAAAAFSSSLSAVPFAVGEFSLGAVLAFALTLYIGFCASPAKGAVAGLFAGLALGGAYAPVLALSGLVSSMFAEVHPLLAGVSSVLSAVSAMLYFSGAEGVLEMLPEVLFAAFSVTLFVSLGILKTKWKKKERSEEEGVLETLLARKGEWEKARHMEALSRSMTALSQSLRGFSARLRRPAPSRLTDKCLEIFRSHCEGCSQRGSCRGLAAAEGDRLAGKIASRLMSSGKLDRERLYELTGVRCPELEEISSEISALAARMLEEAIREDKTEVFAAEYENMAGMFADAAADTDTGFPVDRVLSDKLRRALGGAGITAENAVVCGDRKKFAILTGSELARGEIDLSFLRTLCEEVTGLMFGEPSFMLEKGKSALMLESLPLFRVERVVKKRPKKGESVSGDSASVLENGDGYAFSFVCDGMGSGEDAAMTAELCRVFLEKMLLCGNKRSATLQMLNRFLTARTTECFAAVDLAEIDLVLGVVLFYKSGAAPSYVIRGGSAYKISSGTFPIGILPELSLETTEFELCDGDIILLSSDGVSPLFEGAEEKLTSFFAEEGWELSSAAEGLLDLAEALSETEDDRTVALLRVERI